MLEKLLKEKILLLDGAMGTMIQKYNFSEEDFRGERFKSISFKQKGNYDLLNITQEESIRNIHREYLEAGADIIETNSFNSNSISMQNYGLENIVEELNIKAAQNAKSITAEFNKITPNKPRFVAGSVGPTNKSASVSTNIPNASKRNITFDNLVSAYFVQISALIKGGVDLILIETVFDATNAKAALFAAHKCFEKDKKKVPIMLSATINKNGQLLSGETIKTFLSYFSHFDLFSIGLNCSFGATDLLPYLRELSKNSRYPVSIYPNAGLPNKYGEYDETAEEMAEIMKIYANENLINIVGGCCGTTPNHIVHFAKVIENIAPRKSPKIDGKQ